MTQTHTIGGKWLDDLNRDLTGSERSCAVLAGAILDDRLKTLLENYLLAPEQREDKLLGRSGSLGSFAARIELACRLNLISRKTRKALDWIRDIRNDASHETLFTFDTIL
jgi:mannitol operon repressor